MACRRNGYWAIPPSTPTTSAPTSGPSTPRPSSPRILRGPRNCRSTNTSTRKGIWSNAASTSSSTSGAWQPVTRRLRGTSSPSSPSRLSPCGSDDCQQDLVSAGMTRPLTLLLSAHALKTWGPRIEAAVPAGGLSFRTAEEALAADGACEADIAFMTREVTGRSSKDNPTPELSGFETVLRKSPGLKWLQIHPAGAERPIYRELRGRGVKVTTASGATAVTVAHSTLGALIALNRRLPLLADAQRRHAWEPRLGERAPRDLKGQCAVIVGLGPIGRNIAG